MLKNYEWLLSVHFLTQNKTGATVALHAGRPRNQEQWLSLLRGAKEVVWAMFPGVTETLAMVNYDLGRR